MTSSDTAQVIQFNFINHSDDVNNSSVVIFQKNVSIRPDEIAIAWQVIQNCGKGENYSFAYAIDNYISASDSYDNYSEQLLAKPGDAFELSRNATGDVLAPAGSAYTPGCIELKNNLAKGAINANIYKSGKLFAQKTDIIPGQMAAFEPKATLYIGVASQVEEGAAMSPATLSTIITEISLVGMVSADIIMTGGGTGANAVPFRFTVQKAVMA
jgi:hypothetical protein